MGGKLAIVILRQMGSPLYNSSLGPTGVRMEPGRGHRKSLAVDAEPDDAGELLISERK